VEIGIVAVNEVYRSLMRGSMLILFAVRRIILRFVIIEFRYPREGSNGELPFVKPHILARWRENGVKFPRGCRSRPKDEKIERERDRAEDRDSRV